MAAAGTTAPCDARDFGYLFWPGNHWYTWNVYQPVRYVQTGYYGIALDVMSFSFDHLGLVPDGATPDSALLQDNAVIETLPTASVQYSITTDTSTHIATGFATENAAPSNPSRVIDMGRFMQCIDVPNVTYDGAPDHSGSVQLAAMPRHFALTHRATDANGGSPLTVRLHIDGNALSMYGETTWLDGDRAVSVNDAGGNGWNFIIQESAGAVSQATRDPDGSLTFTNSFAAVGPGEEVAISVIAVPSNAGNSDQLSVWLSPGETVSVQSAQMNRDGSGGTTLVPATWDPERGVHVVQLRNLSDVGAPGWANWSDPNIHNWYNRHRLVIENSGSSAVSVPMAFEAGNNAAFYIVGGSPMFRDTNGEPTGAPMQISKNWHETPFWYHLYSAMQLAPGTHELEHTFAHSKWGEAFAAAHSQLSLVGWSSIPRNQQWDESSLGAFGETITYDPDLTLGRAMVDDVRPFLVNAGGEWGWTGNVGGANFLLYDTGGIARPEHQLGRLRTNYEATGPNLTNVTYAGITRDGKVEAKLTTQLGRTDDLVRVYYHLEYTFLETVDYDRLAFFQMAADWYGDNGFARYAYGNANGVTEDLPVPDHGTTGYASTADRGIMLDGDDPWVMLYDNTKLGAAPPEEFADIGFIIRDYEANIGGTIIDVPHINIYRTFNGQPAWSQMSFELGLPYDAADTVIPAGSTFRATVEYVVPPSVKSTYYGPSDYLLALPETTYRSTDMMAELATGNHLDLQTSIGTPLRTYPPEFTASAGNHAVEFTLTGGRGYTPISVHGLPSAQGWLMQRKVAGAWESLGQEVEGNDYWQAVFDPVSGSYRLVFNVHNRETTEYRLIAADCADSGACCNPADGSCTEMSLVDCEAAGGVYQGACVACGGVDCPAPCVGDIDGDGSVGFKDLVSLLGAWGSCAGGCAADLDEDEMVGFPDLVILLSSWGPCP